MSTQPKPIPLRPAARNEPPKSIHLSRAAFSRFVAIVSNRPDHEAVAYDFCARTFSDDIKALRFLKRTAVDAGTSAGWAAELAAHPVQEFVASLAPQSAAAQLIQAGVTIPLASNQLMLTTQRVGRPTALPWAGEGSPISTHQFTFSNLQLGPPRKFGVLVVCTREIANTPNGLAMFDMLLRENAAAALDAAYFSAAAGSDAVVEGLLYGVTATAPTGGGDDDAIKADLAALAASVSTLGSGQVMFFAAPERAQTIAIRCPDLNATIVPSIALPTSRIIAVDPQSVLHGMSDEISIAVGRDAAVHMETSPAEIVPAGSPGTTAAPVRSLWQTDSLSTRTLLDITFVKRRAGAAAFMDALEW
jgi:hypothetical protein